MIVAEWIPILAADPDRILRMRDDFGAQVVAAQSELSAVSKGSHNDSQGYEYTSAADVQMAVTKVLGVHGLHIMSAAVEMIDIGAQETKNGSQWQRVIVKTTVRIGNGIFYFEGSAFGGGSDSGDKATMKANTASMKYALCAALGIAMGDDPEAAKQAEEAARPEDPGLVWYGPHRGKSLDAASATFLRAYYAVASTKNATPEHYGQITSCIARAERENE